MRTPFNPYLWLIATGLLLIFSSKIMCAQESVDGDFVFQTDSAKKYALYIPSAYSEDTPNRLMLGLHPLNTSRWDAISWRDTLKTFAEDNGLILVCPDGGIDGAIDDPIDTAFTSALLDSVENWYNIDVEKYYVMGFSWGGRTSYTYGLSHATRFKGFLPIGAAINGTSEVNAGLQANSADKPVYIVHGEEDAPTTRFYPVRDALTDAGAIMNFILMPGIGHTIDFPNRNAILTTAYQWIDSVNCAQISTGLSDSQVYITPSFSIEITPNILNSGGNLQLTVNTNHRGILKLSVINLEGKVHLNESWVVIPGRNSILMAPTDLEPGIHLLVAVLGDKRKITKFLVMH